MTSLSPKLGVGRHEPFTIELADFSTVFTQCNYLDDPQQFRKLEKLGPRAEPFMRGQLRSTWHLSGAEAVTVASALKGRH